jgi:hypothetical protein
LLNFDSSLMSRAIVSGNGWMCSRGRDYTRPTAPAASSHTITPPQAATAGRVVQMCERGGTRLRSSVQCGLRSTVQRPASLAGAPTRERVIAPTSVSRVAPTSASRIALTSRIKSRRDEGPWSRSRVSSDMSPLVSDDIHGATSPNGSTRPYSRVTVAGRERAAFCSAWRRRVLSRAAS